MLSWLSFSTIFKVSGTDFTSFCRKLSWERLSNFPKSHGYYVSGIELSYKPRCVLSAPCSFCHTTWPSPAALPNPITPKPGASLVEQLGVPVREHLWRRAASVWVRALTLISLSCSFLIFCMGKNNHTNSHRSGEDRACIWWKPPSQCLAHSRASVSTIVCTWVLMSALHRCLSFHPHSGLCVGPSSLAGNFPRAGTMSPLWKILWSGSCPWAGDLNSSLVSLSSSDPQFSHL